MLFAALKELPKTDRGGGPAGVVDLLLRYEGGGPAGVVEGLEKSGFLPLRLGVDGELENGLLWELLKGRIVDGGSFSGICQSA